MSADDDFTPAIPRLDLGSGRSPAEGYIGVDRSRSYRVIGWNLICLPWPWADETIEALHSSHFIEHIPRETAHGRDLLVRFFEEAWRICKPGALFRLRWPVPFDPDTNAPLPSAWWDPTHYRHIPHQQIYSYFSKQGRIDMGVEDYGILCNWVPTGDFGIRNLNTDASIREYDVELRRDPL